MCGLRKRLNDHLLILISSLFYLTKRKCHFLFTSQKIPMIMIPMIVIVLLLLLLLFFSFSLCVFYYHAIKCYYYYSLVYYYQGIRLIVSFFIIARTHTYIYLHQYFFLCLVIWSDVHRFICTSFFHFIFFVHIIDYEIPTDWEFKSDGLSFLFNFHIMGFLLTIISSSVSISISSTTNTSSYYLVFKLYYAITFYDVIIYLCISIWDSFHSFLLPITSTIIFDIIYFLSLKYFCLSVHRLDMNALLQYCVSLLFVSFHLILWEIS